MRSGAGLEVVEEPDLEFVGVEAGLHVVDRHVETGSGASGHVDRKIEGADMRLHRLIAKVERVQRIRQYRGRNPVPAKAADDGVGHG